jgi:Asp-tRNA(Asn)/Glu-tRNA(Gln) amidotransferase A subunit family amidase
MVKRPTPEQLREISASYALDLSEADVDTCSFDVVGYPSMTVPCGLSEGLPVGVVLVGGSWDEAKILKAARAFEAAGSYDAARPEGIKSVR